MRGLRTVGVITIGRRVVGAVEGSSNVGGERIEPCRIVGLANLSRDPAQNLRVLAIIRVGGQRNRRVLRVTRRIRPDVIPVAQSIWIIKEVADRLILQVVKIVCHHGIIVAQQGVIAGKKVMLPGNDDDRTAPFRRVAKSAAEHREFRRNVGHQARAGRSLAVGHVLLGF